MTEYSLWFRLLPLAAVLCVASCLGTDGYYRYQDAGPSGAAGDGTPGTAGGGGGTTGSAGAGGQPAGVAGNTATGTAGRGGTTGTAGSAASRGGTTGSAGRGGTTGAAGRGGTTGAGGSTGLGGSGSVLFSDDFETGTDGWDFTLTAPSSVVMDGATKALSMSETAGDQALAAAGDPRWTNFSVEAKVKVTAFTGTSSSDGVALCARFGGPDLFYYFAIQASDGKGKIKINNKATGGSNTSLSSSIDIGFVMNTWMTLRLDVVGGTTLTAYVNGVQKATFTVTDAGQMLAMGGAGFMIQRANALFDDIVVRSLP